MIKQLPLWDWENMVINAEVAPLEATKTDEEKIMQMRDHVFALSAEVRRLRLTYGEPCWFGVNTTKEEDEAERAMYSKSAK
jgi:hypothetical protein